MTAEANTVKMFTTTWCGFCKGTKRYLDSKGVAYEEIDIEQSTRSTASASRRRPAFRTVPTLEIGGKLYVNPSRKEMDSLLKRLAGRAGRAVGSAAISVSSARPPRAASAPPVRGISRTDSRDPSLYVQGL